MHSLTTFFQCQWGRSHSAYISGSATIHYRWCDLFESSLPVLRRIRREDGDWLICESPQGNAISLPVWMTDQVACRGFSAGPPVVSLSALHMLRIFLDALHPTSECDKPSGNTSPLERPDETTKKGASDTDRAVLREEVRQRSGSSRATARSTSRTQKKNRRVTAQRGDRRRRRSSKRRRP